MPDKYAYDVGPLDRRRQVGELDACIIVHLFRQLSQVRFDRQHRANAPRRYLARYLYRLSLSHIVYILFILQSYNPYDRLP